MSCYLSLLMLLTVGIDPGLSGAIALDDGKRVRVWDMPTTEVRRNRKTKDRIDDAGLLKLARMLALLGPASVVLEDVWGLPRQSASGGFVFGDGFGAVRMAFISCGLTVHRAHSTVWKAYFRISGDKSASCKRASEVFPGDAHQWHFKARNGRMAELDGRAEAALIARYARHRLTESTSG